MNKIATRISFPLLKTSILGTLMLGIVAPTTLSSLPAEAVELGGGRTFFVRAPRLVDATATHKAPGARSTYKFTIAVPENAGEPLKAVRITQKPSLEDLDFNIDESHASLEDSMARKRDLSVSSIGGMEPDEEEITVVFDQPVQPGSTVTVAVPGKNPTYGGAYQFGVTVFPIGEGSPGLYLGSTRLTFPSSD